MSPSHHGRLPLLAGAACMSTLCLALVARPARAASTLDVKGILDVAMVGREDLRYLNTTNFKDSGFDPMRGRIFFHGQSERTQAFVQILMSGDSVDPMRVYGAYLLHKPLEAHELYLEAGRIPTHDGTWARRAYSTHNPLIGVPLAYYWHSTLPYRMLPSSLDALLAQRGSGQTGVYYTDDQGNPRGTPWSPMTTIYDSCWNTGFYVLGTERSFEYACGVTYGPSSAPVDKSDDNDELSLHAKVGYQFLPGLKTSVAYSQGAYMSKDVQPFLPAGKSVNDYKQRLFIASVEASMGHAVINAELFVNKFETPLRADGLSSRSFYADVQYDFLPGWYAALRYDVLGFGDVVASSGMTTSWDQNIERIEGGLGYHVSRDLLVKGVLQATNVGEGYLSEYVLPTLQASFSF